MARKKPRANGDGLPSRQSAGTSWSPDHPDLLHLLNGAEICGCRPIMWGSNSTFLLTLDAGEGGSSHAIYKPRRGETPLWDFPRGTLYRREMATYLVSEALGWGLVPPTVVREGPYGAGTVQLFIEHNPEEYFGAPAQRDREAAERIALLDALLNNADRKSEHCLYALDGKTWAIDHGLTFHTEPKLRTVIWEFAGEAIPAPLLADMERLRAALDPKGLLAETLQRLVAPEELQAVRGRLRALIAAAEHPDPGSRRRATPWPNW